MNWPDDQVEELKKLFGEVHSAEEGGVTFFMFTSLTLPDHCTPSTMKALLCPTTRDGYTSRLFFANKIIVQNPTIVLNWNIINQRILEENWQAYSWKINRTDLRLAQMVADHIGALK